MKVYLAAPYAARERIRAYAEELGRLGMVCTSTWLNEAHEINAGTQGAATALDDDTVSGHAVMDLLDVARSNVLVLFTSAYVEVESGGGRHVETGYALARKLPVVVVGEPENVFHRIQRQPGSHPWDVEVVADWHQAVIELVQLRDTLRTELLS